MWEPSVCLTLILALIIFSSNVLQIGAAGGDCMSGFEINCFECNSWEDPRCHDPFNYSIYTHEMPKTQKCRGCCVKMVQFIGTEHYSIRRTCTEALDVNFFMVNHACMIEGHRHGKMCFCEEDECNVSSTLELRNFSAFLVAISTTFFVPSWLTL